MLKELKSFIIIEKIHNVHITKNGVDCEECHNSIEHGKIKMISHSEANCENCHHSSILLNEKCILAVKEEV